MIVKIVPYQFILILIGQFSFAQITYLKGLLLDDTNMPVKNETIIFSGHGQTVTDSNGEFKHALPDNITSIQIRLSNGLEILSPPESTIFVPKDSNLVVQILAGQSFENQVIKKLDQLQNSYNDTILVGKLMDNFISQIQSETERKIKLFEERRKFMEDDINRRRKRKQAETIKTLTTLVNHFITVTKDLRDAWADNENRLFYDTGSNLIEVLDRIKTYSKAYEDINRNKEGILQEVKINWTKDHNSIETRELLSYILDQFHRITILKYNVLINDVNDYNQRVKGRRKKTEIKSDIRKFVRELSEGIQYIEREKVRVVQKLSND